MTDATDRSGELERLRDLLLCCLPVLDDHPRSYFRRLALEIREELGMDDA